MKIHSQYDPDTNTVSYVVYSESSGDAVIIDPVLNYDPVSRRTSTKLADELIAFVGSKDLEVHYILETHAHADHLSSAYMLRKALGAPIVIGEKIREVQQTFKQLFGLPESFPTDGSQFDQLVGDGETLHAGELDIEVLETPGHTPACVTYRIGDALFTGDALFMDDFGTGRCDFPKGSASALYRSVHDRLYALPGELRVFVGHDYQPNGRPLRYETTVASARDHNVQLRQDTSFESFVEARESRDSTLSAPKLLFESIQVNINGGRLPSPEANETRYFKIPINLGRCTDDGGQSCEREHADDHAA